MPQIINTNLASINAQRNLDKSQSENQTALQRLSSGLRINSAKDDAAGLAISTRFSAQVQGLKVAIRNASDGVSLAQVAEGALGSMTDNLLRIRDLALQASNATNSKQDREALNEEVQQLITEIERVADQTTFNGTKLLDGSFTDVTFQIGANEGEDVSFGIEGTDVTQLGVSPTDGISSSPGSTASTPPVAALAAGDLVINGIAIGASSGVDDAFSSSNNDLSAIAKAAAINSVSEQTGVSASIQGTFVDGNSFTSANVTGNIVINGITIDVETRANLSETVNLTSVAETINNFTGQTGVEAIFNGNPTEGIQLRAEDGRNVVLADGTATASAIGLAAAATYTGSFTLVSDDGSPISVDTTTGGIGNAGLAVGTYSGNNSGVVSAPSPGAALASGDIVINGVPVGPTLTTFDTASTANSDQSAIAKAEAINRVSEQTGVVAKVNANILNGGGLATGTAITGTFDINDVSIDISVSATATTTDIQNATITAINNKAGQSGVRAEAFGSTYRLIAEDGRNMVLDNYTGAVTASFANLGLPATGTETRGTISLESSGKITLETLTGNIGNSGFEVGEYGGAEDGILVKDIDVSTVAGAIAALDAVDNALNTINLQRANLGAIQNRFESTIQNQQIAAENLSASNSRIKDADFAAETAELSRTQVLQQAGLSILTQANAQPESVLQLLQ
ncbi:flagellin [Oleiphilus sp. HI0125]|uniref:flagellin N-terminal helical domain-containing protein n=2 Tax=Oleiphilus sp. HI0125 TaxID=1822266 RepID=UPI0007C3D328|nr:flagellin [Oleiphilus sp. HI0125]KZZ56002.1 flagellin [Oleiphilus sp. HI0125]